MKTGFPISFCASLLACLVCSSPSTFATPQVQKQSVVSNALSSPLIAQNSRAGATSNSAGAGTQETSRERRAQAYAKLLEGQRYLMSSRRSRSSERSLQSAREAFAQAAQLDPALAEAHTALAELAFFREDLEQAEREATAAIRINRDNFGAHRLLSRIYVLRSGLPEGKIDRAAADRAINELQEVVRLDSNNAEAWALLGELYSATNREREAINAYMRWAAAPVAIDGRIFQAITQGRLELSPDAAAARLGEALLRNGRVTEAVAALRRAVALEPSNQQYLVLLGLALEASGDSGGAIAELQRAVDANPANSAALGRLARLQARAGRVDEAVATLRGRIARSSNPRDQFLLRYELAQILADALRLDEAITTYEELLRERGITNAPLASEDDKQIAADVLGNIINLQRQANRFSDELASIERLRRLLGSTDPTADLQYIVSLREQGKRREALQAVRAARPRYPNDSRFVRLEAFTLAELGRVDEGVALLRAQLKGTPEDYEQYSSIASVYLQVGRGPEAVEAARKALELATANQPEFITQSLFLLSSAQERAGDAKGSEESLRRVLAKEPNNPTALNNLGYFLVERNERLTEALEMIQRAVRAQPTNASFLDSLGWAYFKLGQLEEAERYLIDAARRSTSSSTVQEHLGDVYNRRGKTDLARSAWLKALSLSTEQAEIDRIKAKLGDKNRK